MWRRIGKLCEWGESVESNVNWLIWFDFGIFEFSNFHCVLVFSSLHPPFAILYQNHIENKTHFFLNAEKKRNWLRFYLVENGCNIFFSFHIFFNCSFFCVLWLPFLRLGWSSSFFVAIFYVWNFFFITVVISFWIFCSFFPSGEWLWVCCIFWTSISTLLCFLSY